MTRLVLSVVLAAVALGGCNCGLAPLSHIVGPGSIVGRVCDPGEGKGVYGADVYVVAGKDGHKVSTLSDADGQFDLTDVPPGTYTVYVERGSFSTTVESVVVTEGAVTTLDESTCIAPTVSKLLVVSGHDSVESVLQRLGYFNFSLIDSHFRDHTSTTPSWFVQAFSDLATIEQNDIVFINCGPHEWALDDADPQAVDHALANLRAYVAQGGSLYVSDWAYDILERLYPDAATWYGHDYTEDSAQKAIAQTFVGHIASPDLAAAMGSATVSLAFEQSQVAVAVSLGPTATALITADVDVKVSRNNTDTLTNVPVLFEVHPADLAPGSKGRVIYTSFHNGPNNTADMDAVLRAIVFTL